MVVLITPSEGNGGILQFSTTMVREMKNLADCTLFVPDTVDEGHLAEVADNVCRYTKIKTVYGCDKRIKALCKRIIAMNPEKVIFLEDSVLMQQMNTILRKKNIITAIVIHDVVYHPANSLTIRRRVVEWLRQWSLKRTINSANYIVLLSDNSIRYFKETHKHFKAKTIMFRLGAHVPDCMMVRPPELKEYESEYLLFFGRIDKYKGIGRMCKAYSDVSEELQETHGLLIAGRGEFSEEEQALIAANENIRIINRFISNEEMTWLMANTKAVLVPYIEASQSGVVPIAYHYQKPVISSNLAGLTENVVDGKTGHVFESDSELVSLLEDMCRGRNMPSKDTICSYYRENYDWKKNIEKLLIEIV